MDSRPSVVCSDHQVMAPMGFRVENFAPVNPLEVARELLRTRFVALRARAYWQIQGARGDGDRVARGRRRFSVAI